MERYIAFEKYKNCSGCEAKLDWCNKVCNECKIKFPTILGLGFNISKCSDYYIYDKNNFSYQFNKIFEKAIDI